MRDESDVSRRKVLGGLALAGGAGAVVGTGTGAMLSDDSAFVENRLTAGALDLRVEWDGGSSEGDESLGVDLSDGDGERTVTVSLTDGGSNNPAYAWLGATCPEPTPLVGNLRVTLSYADCESGNATEELVSGWLHEVADELADGIPLDADGDASTAAGEQSCLRPGDELCLLLEWQLEEGHEGEDEADFDLEFVGRQCRHSDGETNPFPGETCEEPPDEGRRGISFVEIYACDDDGDALLGKLELEDGYCGQADVGENSIELGSYDLYDDGDGCTDTGYDVLVTDAVEKDDDETIGIAFEVVRDGTDAGPDLCRVDVKAGPTEVTYGADSFDGNATNGVLVAPTTGDRKGGSPGNGGNGGHR